MKKVNRLPLLFYFCIAIAAVIAVGSAMMSEIEDVTISNESLSEFSSGWKLTVDDDARGTIDLPFQLDAPQNAVVSIQSSLPGQLKQNSTLFFRSSQSFVKIFVGDKLLHSFGYESKQAFGRSPGSAWQIARIPIDDFGKEITIQFVSPYPRYSGELSPIYIGTKAAIVFHILGQNLLGVLISLLIFMAGISLLILYGFTQSTRINDAPLYLGLFSILMALWTVGESKLLQLFWGNTFFLTNLVYLSLLLLPIPFLLFLLTFTHFRSDKFIPIFVVLFSANFVVTSILQLCGAADYFSTLVSVLVLIVLAAVYLLLQLIFRWKQFKNTEMHVFAFSLAALLLSGIIATISFYSSGKIESTAVVRFGFLIFIAILGIWVTRQALFSFSNKIEQDALKTLAYTDILTKLHNRAAFEAHMDLYRNGKDSKAVVVMFDLNNLKLINDTQSHSAGDHALMVSANLLQESFSPLGSCYRIGGDEFCVICDGDDYGAVDHAIASLHRHLERINRNHNGKLSIAYGIARFTPGEGNIDATFRLADAEMYACKSAMKSQMRENTIKI